jgi:hypothetical protein
MKKGMAEERQRLSMGGKRLPQNRLTLQNILRIACHRYAVEIDVGKGMIPEVGAGVEPHVQYFAKLPGTEFRSASRVHESDYGNASLAKGFEELLRHRARVPEISRTASIATLGIRPLAVAGYVPALRAARIDPLQALRSD